MKKTDIIELLKRMKESSRITQKNFEERGDKENAEGIKESY